MHANTRLAGRSTCPWPHYALSCFHIHLHSRRVSPFAKSAPVISKAVAHWLRLVLGAVMALGVGIVSYMADGGALLTYVAPLIIGLLTVADFIGFLSNRGQ